MTTYDFAPLFRTAIGFDRLARLAAVAGSAEQASYPPYNIERTAPDAYRLTMAVAGFAEADIELTVKENTLVVAGKPAEAPQGEVLHRGIAGRAFERRFVLADHVQVENASLANGLLHVSLKRVVPEALKPRRIAIGASQPQIEAANTDAPATQAA